jgi:GNAT superfamily N-acetyltransferase
MPVSVRRATEEDIPEVLAMGAALHAESPRYSALTYNPAKVEFLARHVIADPEGGALVAEKDGKIIGMMAGFVAPHWFSDDLIASDYTFYVKPEHRRKGRAALMLVRAFEEWAAAHGAVSIVPGTSTQIDADSTARFYEKLGYERTGFTFCKGTR